MDHDDAVAKLMKEFDTTLDTKVDFNEFVAGVEKWLDEAKGDSKHSGSMKYIDKFHNVWLCNELHELLSYYIHTVTMTSFMFCLQETKRQHALVGDQSDEVVEGVENARWTKIKAALLLLLGAAIAAAFADPLVDAVDNFSDATSIPTFFISFIALPFATNSSEAVSAIIFATRKKIRSASLTFSEVCYLIFTVVLVDK